MSPTMAESTSIGEISTPSNEDISPPTELQPKNRISICPACLQSHCVCGLLLPVKNNTDRNLMLMTQEHLKHIVNCPSCSIKVCECSNKLLKPANTEDSSTGCSSSDRTLRFDCDVVIKVL